MSGRRGWRPIFARMVAFAALLLLCTTSSLGAPKQRLDLIFIETPDTSYGQAAIAFKRLVETRSGGSLGITLHPEGQWGGHVLEDLDMIAQVRTGHAHIALVSTAPLSNLCPELEVLNYPFLFSDYTQAYRALDSAVGHALLAATARHGLRTLVLLDGGFRLFATTRPVRGLADFRGLRVRTLQNRTYVGLVKAFGGVPVPAAIRKIREMVARGFIEAADRSYPTYGSLDLYRVLRYVTETNHAYLTKALVVNEAVCTSLSPAHRALLEQAADQVARRHRMDFRAEIEAVRKRARQSGVQIIPLTPAERRAFEVASRPVQEEVARIVGADLVARVRAAARGISP